MAAKKQPLRRVKAQAKPKAAMNQNVKARKAAPKARVQSGKVLKDTPPIAQKKAAIAKTKTAKARTVKSVPVAIKNTSKVTTKAQAKVSTKPATATTKKNNGPAQHGKEAKSFRTPVQAYPSPVSPGAQPTSAQFQPLNLRSLSLASLPILAILGHGGFGVVYKSEHNGTSIAVKKFKLSHGASNKGSPSANFEEQQEAFHAELEAFKKVGRHPHCVEFYGYGIDKVNKEFAIILELAPFGSLSDIVANKEAKQIQPKMFLPVLQQIVSGIKHLHDHNMVHRDIKPDNVLVYSTDPPLVKISDFGLLRKQEQDITKLRTFAGTPFFLPPELDWTAAENGKSFKAKKTVDFYAADIWALGILITEIVTAGCLSNGQLGMLSKAARADEVPTDSRYSLRNVTREVLLESGVGKCPPWVADLIEKCLQKKPSNRLKIGEIQDILKKH